MPPWSILAPGLTGVEAAGELPFASSLCGACAEACPVRIPIPRLLHLWRERARDARLPPLAERVAMAAYTRAMTNPPLYRLASAALRTLPAAVLDGDLLPVVRGWSGPRAGLEPSPKPFHRLWQDGIR